MENLCSIKQELENLLGQIDREPGTLDTLYCQKSIQEAIFWIGKQIDKLREEN